VPLTTLVVREVMAATPRTRRLRIDTGPEGFAFLAGQAVMVGLHGSPLRKPYSIASAPGEAARFGRIELLVQVDDSGGPDPHLELAAAGTLVDVDGPFGSFAAPPAAEGGPLLLVAGGTGIAPLRSMLLDMLERTPAPRLHVVLSARTTAELGYRDELEGLAAAGRIHLWLTVTRDQDEAWQGRRGRIDRALLADALPPGSPWCLVCGPAAFVRDAQTALAALGVPAARIGIERYDT
jgi:ferredoxin-NADP reductase